jgi:glycosyltransferase involved in cell wall biosynthesis
MKIHFLIPGDPHTLTGGYLYNIHIINGLKQKGHTVSVLGTDWQWKNRNGLEKVCRHHLVQLPDGACVIIDSLVLAPLCRILQEFGNRIKFLGLMHMPVSYDISSGVHGELGGDELFALGNLRQVIVTGRFTFDLLCNAGLERSKIRIAEPGTERFPRKMQYKTVPSELLCIANYAAAKAQDVLIRALFRLIERDWTLHLYGDPDRDTEYAASVSSLIQQLKMEDRIFMHGIIEREFISQAFLNSDLFVMPSLFESYGMALTESLAHGIPVVTTLAGNIPYTVPAGMGILTQPGNDEQLADAIRFLLDEPVKYSALCNAASQYYRQARTWEEAVEDFERILLQTVDDKN